MAADQIERWSGLKVWLYSLCRANPPSNRATVVFAGVGDGDRVLDIGCGPGASLERARQTGAEVFGVDPSPGMVARAARRVPDATVVEGSAETLDFPNDYFTHVWTISSFHHWADPGQGIEQARRVLAEGGRCLIVERKLKGRRTGHGLNVEDAESLTGTISDHGFHDCRVDTIRAGRSDYLVVSGRT